ncbi:MAG TPA: UbiA family prenyltransferase [Ideonella sp.]|nr:UbiA family prenyltransferase [Ideonella sp.]
MAPLAPAEAPAPAAAPRADVPLVVDLDGTLVRTDSLLESLFVQAKARPLSLLALPRALLGGRAALKGLLAANAMPDIETLPYHRALLRWLGEQKRGGRRLVLATGADERVARRVAERLGLFDAVFASDGRRNLTGEEKRRRLVEAFGERGFDYAGNSARDLPVWRSARRAVLVGSDGPLAARLRAHGEVEAVFGDGHARPGVYLHAMRWHHWLKNLLVFVPLLAARRLYDPAMLGAVALAFAGFCLAASSVYLLNDLIDLPGDRRHPHKRDRPLASGRMPVGHAVALVPLLWLGLVGVAAALPAAYGATLAGYVALMLAYTLRLKDRRFLDAALLGGGYTLRLLAGAAALRIDVPPWLCAWSLLMFFSLAMLKRRAEVATAARTAGVNARARGYRASDVATMETVGRVAGAVAVLLLALYPVVEPAAAALRTPVWLIGAVLLYWMRHMWEMAGRGRIHDDPVMFALRDPRSRAAGLAVLALLAAIG